MMERAGIGSASIILVFAVLCLAIFTVISFVPALIEQNLIESELRSVGAYFAADALAEQILAQILAADGNVPDIIRDVAVHSHWDSARETPVFFFAAPMDDYRAIHVAVAINGHSYEILSWRMVSEAIWEADDRLPVFTGW